LWRDVLETAVGDHTEVKRAKTEAREAQEKTKAEALSYEGRRRDLIEAHRVKVGRLNGELTTAKEALEKAQESFRDLEANKQRFMQIAPLMPESDKTLVKIDNELTELCERQVELHALCDQHETSGDERLARVRDERQKVETRIQELHPLRAAPAELRAEFEGLYFRLTGFKPTEIVLYEEAQRDRNDAAQERAKAKVELDQAEATRTAVQEEERLLQERVAKFEAYQAEQLAILNSGKEAKLREWQDIERCRAETDSAKLKAQSYLAHILQLMQDLLNQMELGGLTPEEFLELKRPSGIVQELARTIGGLKQTIDLHKQDLEAINGNYRSSVDRASGLNGELTTLRDELTKVNADLEQAKGELEQLNTSSGEQITKLQTVIADKQGEIDGLLSRMQSSEDSIDLDGDALKQHDPPKDLMAAAGAVENPQGSGARKTKGYEEGELLPKPEVATDFFQALRHALVSKEQIVVDSAEKVWLLFDLQRRDLFRFGLAGIFPEGLPDKLKGLEKRDSVSARLAKAKIPDMQWFLEVFEPNRPTNYPHVATAT
jgi:chromosome segregation ATPase